MGLIFLELFQKQSSGSPAGGLRRGADTQGLPVRGELKTGKLEPRSRDCWLHRPPPWALRVLPDSSPRLPLTPTNSATPPCAPRFSHLARLVLQPALGGRAPGSAPSLRVARAARHREAGLRAPPSLRLLSSSTRSSLGRRRSSRSATATAATLHPRSRGAAPRPWSPGGPLGS